MSESEVNRRNQVKPQSEASRRAQEALKGHQKQKSFFTQYGYHIVIATFIITCVAAIVFQFSQRPINAKTTLVIDEAEMERWNAEAESQQYKFRQGANDQWDGYYLEGVKDTLNNKLFKQSQGSKLRGCQKADEDGTIIPEKFNFREKFEECAAPIVAQGSCSTNYVLTATSTIADRMCMSSEDQVRVNLNPQTYTSCAEKQQSVDSCKKGGVTVSFFHYVRVHGLVDDECFAFKNDNWDQECPEELSQCQRHKMIDFCVLETEESMKREIMNNGPIITHALLHQDLLTYKDGVYHEVKNTRFYRSYQQFKIIGWDQDEEGDHLWIAENTWGDSWGENGLVRFKAGEEKYEFAKFAFVPVLQREDRDTDETQDEYEQDADEEDQEDQGQDEDY